MERWLVQLIGLQGYGIMLGILIIAMGALIARISRKSSLVSDQIFGGAFGLILGLIGIFAILLAVFIKPTTGF